MVSQKQVMHPERLNIGETIRRFSSRLDRLLGDNIELEFECAEGLPSIRADPGMIERILADLVVHASDAMPQGGSLKLHTSVVEIDESVARRNAESRPGEFVCVSVLDTGFGKRSDALEQRDGRCFTAGRKGGGPGDAMAGVHGIVKRHEGWIEVESRVGSGTLFRVYLPVHKMGFPGGAKGKVHADNIPGGRATVLVAEDDESVRNVLSAVLERFGYTALIADSAATALEIWKERSEDIDLLLTDMVMPGGISGRNLIQILEAEKPALKVILMSGYNPDRSIGEWIRSRRIPFLEKPFSPGHLVEKMCEVLSR